jgi:predicted S18 family serine protease
MEDKTFELLTKMYNDFNQKFEEVKSDIKKISNQVIKLENDLEPKVDALFDGYKQLAEGQKEIKSQLNTISAKVENQDLQITVLKGSKKAAN